MTSYVEVHQFDAHKDSLNSLSFSSDGSFLATGGDDCLLFILDPHVGRILHKMQGQFPVTALRWSTKIVGRLFAGYGDGNVLVAQVTQVRGTAMLVAHSVLIWPKDSLKAYFLPRDNEGDVIVDIVCDMDGMRERVFVCAGSQVEMWRHVDSGQYLFVFCWLYVERHAQKLGYTIAFLLRISSLNTHIKVQARR